MQRHRFMELVTVVLATMMLTACGGGEGVGSDSAELKTAPTQSTAQTQSTIVVGKSGEQREALNTLMTVSASDGLLDADGDGFFQSRRVGACS